MASEYENNLEFIWFYKDLKRRLENLLNTPQGCIIDIDSQLKMLLANFNRLWAMQSSHIQKDILAKDADLMTELTDLTVLILKNTEKEKNRILMSQLSPAMQKMLSQYTTYKV